MKRTWTIIGVRDAASSFKWYQSLFGYLKTEPDHDYSRLPWPDSRHGRNCSGLRSPVGRARHPSLFSPDTATPGNGLLLLFRVEDFDMSLKRSHALARFEEEPNVGTQTIEFSLRDPDGYNVTLSSLS